MKSVRLKYYYFPAPLAYLLISYLCLTKQPFPKDMDISLFFFANIDKVVHAGLYFMVTKATLFQLLKMGKYENKRLRIYWAVVLPIAFGLMVEIVQHFFIEGRSGDVADFAANTVGVFVAYYTFKAISNHLSSKSPGR